jgi:hypothetical protein
MIEIAKVLGVKLEDLVEPYDTKSPKIYV